MLKFVGPARLRDPIKGGNLNVNACPGPEEPDDHYPEQGKAFMLVQQGLVGSDVYIAKVREKCYTEKFELNVPGTVSACVTEKTVVMGKK